MVRFSRGHDQSVAAVATDIRTDPNTKIRFMRMADKTAAGDRFVPVHPQLSKLIDEAIINADRGRYLVHSDAQNKHGERSQPIGKRLAGRKQASALTAGSCFTTSRRTVAAPFLDAGCEEAVAADIIGHNKPTMTYGLYGGETRMDLRARWLAKAIRYPLATDGRRPTPGRTTEDPQQS